MSSDPLTAPAPLRIGAGAGFADDRIEPAHDLAEAGAVDYLVFECLAERTIARETLARKNDPSRGFNPHLVARMEAVLPACRRNGIRVVTNMGAANPLGGAEAAVDVARGLGFGDMVAAAVTGDDVSELILDRPDLAILETGEPVEAILPAMVAANAYLGADAVCLGLQTGAEIVVTGRVADPSLFLAPAMHHFGWQADELPLVAAGTTMGHLLECSTQVTGGCFADPTRPEKAVKGLADLGNPIAEIGVDGALVVTKLAGTGGRVDRMTCTEQLLYEVHDPSAYLTPDCALDMTGIHMSEDGPNRVKVSGAQASGPPERLKVAVAYDDGFIGEGEVGYAGVGAVERARLAAEVVRERLTRAHTYDEIRIDLIGMTSLHGERGNLPAPYEVRLRVAARARDRSAATRVGFEVRAMHVNGPTGGGGGSPGRVREIVAVKSVLLPRDLVRPAVRIFGGGG